MYWPLVPDYSLSIHGQDSSEKKQETVVLTSVSSLKMQMMMVQVLALLSPVLELAFVFAWVLA